ncbi:uncharacterized protein LOC117793826 [Drosophila innubila]|uniref:uncharacterized protein LOC117793826 n=1 Tax=Drosophila innubila TaxID=198719 RepID=UPI00148E6B98|nr:uncharacterized protein LOC117793826 [Drosophila innubila]
MSHFNFVALFVCAVLFVLCQQQAEAAFARVDHSNPSHPGKCVLTSNMILSPGQTGKAPNHPCTGVTCMDNGIVEYTTCQALPLPRGCKLRDFVNTNRDFPGCCERAHDCSKHI